MRSAGRARGRPRPASPAPRARWAAPPAGRRSIPADSRTRSRGSGPRRHGAWRRAGSSWAELYSSPRSRGAAVGAPQGSRETALCRMLSAVTPPLVAYFSMEYGLHEEFHSYAVGLGILAGDFMKSAGDLGLPVVGIGLRWAQGYTVQRIGPDGYPYDEWRDYPPDPLTDTGIRVRVRVAAREVECGVWRVGRYAIAPLFLLEPLDPRDRWITRRLYDPTPDCRVAQEMLLGIGGVRALRALHLPVDLYHFNEGHAVFAGIELIADRMEADADFHSAWREVRDKIVFTTHTPVPAGNEVHAIQDLRRARACGW